MKLRKFSIKLIDLYQMFISPYFKGVCVFYPTCSLYTQDAIRKYGVQRGIYLGFFRILKCHPWQKNHIDPVK